MSGQPLPPGGLWEQAPHLFFVLVLGIEPRVSGALGSALPLRYIQSFCSYPEPSTAFEGEHLHGFAIQSLELLPTWCPHYVPEPTLLRHLPGACMGAAGTGQPGGQNTSFLEKRWDSES